MGQEAQADTGASEMEGGQDRGGVPVIADREFAKGNHPGLRALHHPSEVTASLAGVDARPSDARGDAPPPQRLAIVTGSLGFIRMQLGRALAGPSRLTSGAADGLDR